jgi:hypothetical protein
VGCFVSSDIEKGEGWFDRLLRELRHCHAALLCVTPENLSSTWMHFEAGMVLRMAKARVFTYYLGRKAGVDDPFRQLQVTVCTRDDTRKLVVAIARLAGVDSAGAEKSFDRKWDDLEKVVREIETPEMDDLFPEGFAKLFHRKTFYEPIEDCGDQGWLARYEGLLDTRRALEARKRAVQEAGRSWQLWLYEKLLSHLDAYARVLRAYLIEERRFVIGLSGRIDFSKVQSSHPAEVGAVGVLCERRCREIRHVVFCLTRPEGAPVLDESLDFAKMTRDQFDDKKALIQSHRGRLNPAFFGVASGDAGLPKPARSYWDFDRIMFYDWTTRQTESPAADLLRDSVERELQQAEAVGDQASKMPLHYAVKAWHQTLENTSKAAGTFDARAAERVVEGVQEYLDDPARPQDHDPKIRAYLDEIRQILKPSSQGSRG